MYIYNCGLRDSIIFFIIH